jgi:hypothetical protein
MKKLNEENGREIEKNKNSKGKERKIKNESN